jgi:hypothetical protein
MNFWARFHRPSRNDAADLFDGRHVGYIRAAKSCANYASNKAAAIDCRLRGHINNALDYERICDRIYDELPAFARW